MRFETHDFTEQLREICKESSSSTKPSQMFDAHDVKAEFQRVKTNKSMGPDSITGRLLKHCSEQLCDVFCNIFRISLEQ